MLFSKPIRFTFRFFCCTALLILLALFMGCDIKVNDKAYPDTTEIFVVTENNIEDYTVFNKFKKLKKLDLTALDISASDYDDISSKLAGDVEILWNVPVGNTYIRSDSISLDLTPEVSVSDLSFFKYLKRLKVLNLSSIEVSPFLQDIFTESRNAIPDLTITTTGLSLYGIEFTEADAFIDLNTVKITDLSNLEIALNLFPNIKTVEMCSCQLENEVIAAFRDRYPDKKIVWSINVCGYVIRTDAQVFSTLRRDLKRPIDTELAAPIFRYCTELRALDLGHNRIDDISEIVNLQNLHALILADNWITDITPLTKLKNLTYLEIQRNRITDISPLAELPLLEDVYMIVNPIARHNMKTLATCPSMKKLVFSYCGASQDDVWVLKQNLPKGCDIQWGTHFSFRYGYKNAHIVDAFRRWKRVKEFPEPYTTIYWDRDVYNYWQNT